MVKVTKNIRYATSDVSKYQDVRQTELGVQYSAVVVVCTDNQKINKQQENVFQEVLLLRALRQ